MAIADFKNEAYELVISDLVTDIYYATISNSSKIILIRKLTEILSRKFLNLGAGEPLQLGDITNSKKKPNYKTTERYHQVDERIAKDFESKVNQLRTLGNEYTHTKNAALASNSELNKAEDLIIDLFALLFVQYFLKYDLNLQSDKNILSCFSLLPPEIRFRALNNLISIKGYNNVLMLDKYLLAMVKSKTWSKAYSWLLEHREEILELTYPDEDEIKLYTEDLDESKLPLKLNNYDDVYTLLLEKLISQPVMESESGNHYGSFEEAVKEFNKIDLDFYLSNTEEQLEFKELLEFCFIGRVSTL